MMKLLSIGDGVLTANSLTHGPSRSAMAPWLQIRLSFLGSQPLFLGLVLVNVNPGLSATRLILSVGTAV